MNVKKLYINGVKVQANEDNSILEAARKADIYIPSLCYHPKLPSFSKTKTERKVFRGKDFFIEGYVDIEPKGCELCLVELEGKSDLVRACNSLITEGMKVATNEKN